MTSQTPFTPLRFLSIPLLILLPVSIFILGLIAWQRGPEYDEGYTVFVTSGTPRPEWPTGPFRAGDVRSIAEGHSTPAHIAADLRATDVHPPLYFWSAALWRWLAGPSLFGLRLLSVLYGVASLAVVAGIARIGGVSPPMAVILTLGCYGFSYTSAVARGFALAQTLTLAGVLLLLLADQRRRWTLALAGGALLGLATFSNYLAAFVAGAGLLWLLLRRWRSPALWLAAGLGFAAILPADLWFFLAQRGSRAGQFPPFRLLPSLERLAQYAAGDVFGGLPLYVQGMARLALGSVLALLLMALVLLIAARWRRIGTPAGRWLFALGALAPPAGLILLGLVFDTTPIELRYLAFASPFLALLAAGAFASLPAWPGRIAFGGMVAIQAASLAGLAVMPQTMQPQAAATREAAALAGPDGLVLVPRGNDGVGVVEAVVQSAPVGLRLLVVPPGTTPEQIRARAAAAPVIVVALLGLDGDSRATLPAMQSAFAGQACWQTGAATALTQVFTRAPACAPAASR